jgi:predicted exporter
LLALATDEELAIALARLEPGKVEAQARRLRALLVAPGGSSLAPLIAADPLELLPALSARLGNGLPVDAQSGYFRSSDHQALLLYVRPRAPTSDWAADQRLIAEASTLAEGLGAKVAADGRVAASPDRIVVGFTGACAFWMFYRDWLHRDMQLSTVLSGLAVLVLFGVFFRALRALPLVAVPLGIGVVWTAAAAEILYGRINAVSLAFGTILVSIGIDVPIQLYNRLREELGHEGSAEVALPQDALTATVRELAGPSLTASLAPALVFFACGLSSYRGLAELGVLAGVGLLFNWLAMLTVFPALLAALPTRLWARRHAARNGRKHDGALARLGAAVERRPRRFLLVALVAGFGALPLWSRAHFDRRLLSQPPSMPPVRVQAEIEHRFGERERALIALVEDADKERALALADAWLAAIERLRGKGLPLRYSSMSALFPSAATQRHRKEALTRADAKAAAARLGRVLADAGFDLAPFQPFLRQLAEGPPPITLDGDAAHELDFLLRAHIHDGENGRAVATYVYPAPGSERAVATALDDIARGSGGVVTGTPVLEDELLPRIRRDLAAITLTSTLLVALLLGVYYRRLRPWLATMLPLVYAWLLFPAALGALGLPINLYNLLAVPLVIGYGIDDHIFLVHRHQDRALGLGRVLGTTGRAIVLTSVSTMAGFFALSVARFDGLRLLGLSGALAVLLCLVSAFAVLPALLALLFPSHGETST